MHQIDFSIKTSVLSVLLQRMLAGFLLSFLTMSYAGSDPEFWLLVDTQALTLTVMQDDRPQLTLHNISLGRYGSKQDKQRGDNTTPLGRFRIIGIRRHADFHRFISLDYPSVERANRGYQDGLINQSELQMIVAAHRRGDMPPQGTVLGGHIGIHGLGRGDPKLHEAVNWTKGCVALSDAQVDTLLPWVQAGMRVEIR